MREGAIVLTSGGIDSTTAMAIAKSRGFEIYALSFDYGQRHRCELESAKKVAGHFSAREHKTIKIDLRTFGRSALTDNIDVPLHRNIEGIAKEIPVTYVPARNTIFLSYALAWAEVLKVHDIFIGITAVDYSGYPDCRPEYIDAFRRMANLATKEAVEGRLLEIHAPLIHMKKSDIIMKGNELGVDFSITHSCYNPSADGRACGECDSCLLRKRGFDEAGIPDPTSYIT